MTISKDYLDSISKKLDIFNKINGVNPELNREIRNSENIDIMGCLGNSAIKYMENKDKNPLIFPDPLFNDHNLY